MMRVFTSWATLAVALTGLLSLPSTSAEVAAGQIAKDADTVIVAQGDIAITLGDLDAWMQDVPADKRAGFIRSPDRIETTLFQLLMIKQLNREAKAQGLDKDPFIQRQVQMQVERTIARYQREKVANAITAPDLSDLAKERYLANPEQFRGPDVVTVVHLLITEKDRGADAAKKLIDKLYKVARKNPAKLEKLALANSEDPTVQNNSGVLKNVKLADLAPKFAEAARQLQPGELSAPVPSEFGWHLIRLDAIDRGALPAFEDIKDKLTAQLEQEWRSKTYNAYFDDLRQRALKPDPEVMAELPFRYGEVAMPDVPAPPAQPTTK
jgi:hypothetical protein